MSSKQSFNGIAKLTLLECLNHENQILFVADSSDHVRHYPRENWSNPTWTRKTIPCQQQRIERWRYGRYETQTKCRVVRSASRRHGALIKLQCSFQSRKGISVKNRYQYLQHSQFDIAAWRCWLTYCLVVTLGLSCAMYKRLLTLEQLHTKQPWVLGRLLLCQSIHRSTSCRDIPQSCWQK